MEKKAGAPAIANFDLDDQLERARGGKPPEAEPAGECVVCRGQLAPDESREFDAWFGVPVVGPTSRSPYRMVRNGWYCVRCGLKYHHLPSRPETPPS